jgi:hypothetical protein
MAIEDVLILSDTDAAPVMDVGSVVVLADPITKKLAYPKIRGVSDVHYAMPASAGFAIVVSLSPFTLASANGNMRWQTTVNQADFIAVGKAKPDVLAAAMTRLSA